MTHMPSQRASTEAVGVAKENLQSLYRGSKRLIEALRGSKRHILCIQYGQKNRIQRINVAREIECG